MSDEPKSVEEPNSFEEILSALEEEVGRLEQGDLPLEDALASFERGMALAKAGDETLSAAEKKVEMLIAVRDGQVTTQPFDPVSE
ncbi:MAG: exodeoxyribonuclease VII small subunit [Myxococcota bacterium]